MLAQITSGTDDFYTLWSLQINAERLSKMIGLVKQVLRISNQRKCLKY